MIDKKIMWKIITVTMVTLAAAILITAVGGAFILVGNAISSSELLDGPSQSAPAESEGFFDSLLSRIKGLLSGIGEPADTTAPTVTAEKDTVIIYTGDSVSYRSLVKVSDDSGEDCNIKIDSSNVDQSKPGTYIVKYTVTDPSGNVKKFELKVTVKDGTYSLSKLMTLIEQKAQSELGYTKSTVGKRTKVQIVQDIYRYVNDSDQKVAESANIYFNDISNTPRQQNEAKIHSKDRDYWEEDWIEEAYRTLSMDRMQGDCYSYYSVSKAFFEYFGIENEGIQRSQRSNIKGTHYWNIVKVESGWYYYDSTRLGGSFSSDGTRNACLITEAKLNSYRAGVTVEEKYKGEFYTLDKWQGFPTISTKEIKWQG